MNDFDPTLTEADAVASVDEQTVEEVSALSALQLQDALIADAQEAAIPALPIPALPKRPVSGRYTSQSAGFRLEQRIDVDRVRPMKKLSGDFSSVAGAVVTYFGSFIVDSPTVTVTPTLVTVRGTGRFTWSAGAPVIKVTIPRRALLQPQAPATVQFFGTDGAPGAVYVCNFISKAFRSVQLETDRVSDVTTPVFSSHDTSSLPSGGPARTLSVVSAYAEAGIAMSPTAGSDTINVAEAGADTTWSNAELHNSMVRHFSLFRDLPQWAVWQIAAQKHEIGPGLYGIMFDQAGPQRQGCAVFHGGIGGTTPELKRLQLYTYTHELGHCFNLLHSWQKSLASPPKADRPKSLSWMNYPWKYFAGPDQFWKDFAFQFDDEEIVHLRHAFRNDIVMGANPFGTGSSVIAPEVMSDPIEDRSGLTLSISANTNLALGEPVVLTLGLKTSDTRGVLVHPYLHPNLLLTNVVIAKPNGDVVAWEPFIDHLVGPEQRTLRAGEQLEASAYIGFGKGGMYFDQPGTYQIRAAYHALDGSRILSNVATLRVRYPVTAQDNELAELLTGSQQGALFYLLGSDAESLRAGNDAFDIVLDKHGTHPLASYVKLAKGVNAARTFKTIQRDVDKLVHVRQPRVAEADNLLTAAAAPKSPIDPISKAEGLRRLAVAQGLAGNDEGAKEAAKLAANLVRGNGRTAEARAHS